MEEGMVKDIQEALPKTQSAKNKYARKQNSL